MKIYFDRTIPMYLTDKPSFDGIAVDVDESALDAVSDLRELILDTEARIREAAAPERSNQQIADFFVNGLKEITNGS